MQLWWSLTRPPERLFEASEWARKQSRDLATNMGIPTTLASDETVSSKIYRSTPLCSARQSSHEAAHMNSGLSNNAVMLKVTNR